MTHSPTTMTPPTGIVARRTHTPNWEPLTRIVSMTKHRVDPADFMWMGAVLLDNDSSIEEYKHVESRRYLRVDQRGHAWSWTASGGYQRVRSLDHAVRLLGVDAIQRD